MFYKSVFLHEVGEFKNVCNVLNEIHLYAQKNEFNKI